MFVIVLGVFGRVCGSDFPYKIFTLPYTVQTYTTTSGATSYELWWPKTGARSKASYEPPPPHKGL